MKITKISCYALAARLEEAFYFSQCWVRERAAMIVEIETDEGITGWGESLCHGGQPPEAAKAAADYYLKPLLMEQDPFDVEVLWEKMYAATRQVGQQGIIINAMSGIDIALWDIIGKALKLPIHKLIGGAFRKEIKAYATGFYRGEKFCREKAVEEALRHVENGFTGFKMKIGFGVKEDIEYLHQIREAVGYEAAIMADANCAYNAAAARRILLECEDVKMHFFEEPLPPEDIEGYKELKGLTSTYLACGENLFTKIGYRRWIAERAADIFQPELCSSGGITELKKIAALAEAYNVMLIPHVWGSGIGLAASLQYVASLPPAPVCLFPEEPMLEYDSSTHPFRHDLIYGAICLENGAVKIPDNPGIGVEVNKEIILKYAR